LQKKGRLPLPSGRGRLQKKKRPSATGRGRSPVKERRKRLFWKTGRGVAERGIMADGLQRGGNLGGSHWYGERKSMGERSNLGVKGGSCRSAEERMA